MADWSNTTEEEMRKKHPPAAGPTHFKRTNTTTQQLQFTVKEVKKAALSFRKGSAPGPSGLRPEHLNVTLKMAPANRTDRAGAALPRLVNIMAKGEVPEEVAPYLCGARLHGALKKDGGLRPIAVGNLLRRLTSKLVASALAGKASAHLAPNQLGVGVRGGCEAIFHTMRKALEEDPDQWILQADFKNAFNLADRDATFLEVEKSFPECLSWVLSSYKSPSLLQYGDSTIKSEAGFHQGDPLAAFLFSLLLHPVVRKIQEEVPDLRVNAWYLDDGTQVGSRAQLQQVVDILEKEGPARGLHLSTSATVQPPDQPKTTVWSPANLTSEPGDDLLKTVTRKQALSYLVPPWEARSM